MYGGGPLEQAIAAFADAVVAEPLWPACLNEGERLALDGLLAELQRILALIAEVNGNALFAFTFLRGSVEGLAEAAQFAMALRATNRRAR